MDPFHVAAIESTVGLYEMTDGRFQLIEQGTIGPFMCGYSYLLIEKELAEYLVSLNIEKVKFKDAVIFDRKENKEYHTHKEVVISQNFNCDQINDMNLDGDQILLMVNQYIFVSPSLKEKLEGSKFNYLRFSKGLSDFAEY